MTEGGDWGWESQGSPGRAMDVLGERWDLEGERSWPRVPRKRNPKGKSRAEKRASGVVRHPFLYDKIHINTAEPWRHFPGEGCLCS